MLSEVLFFVFLRIEALRVERLEADGSRESGETAQRDGRAEVAHQLSDSAR